MDVGTVSVKIREKHESFPISGSNGSAGEIGIRLITSLAMTASSNPDQKFWLVLSITKVNRGNKGQCQK